jgi:formate-nitrite transporter family protein
LSRHLFVAQASYPRFHSEGKRVTTKPAQKETAPPESTISTRVERKQVEERVAIGAHVVYETIRREGEEELHRKVSSLWWSGLAAGLSMGFSFIAEGLLMAHLPDGPWRLLVSGTGYSVGFLIVVLGRQQLFTENTLTVFLPVLLDKKLSTLLRMLRLWGVVLFANLVGTFLFALAIGRTRIFDAHMQSCLMQIGAAHLGSGFGLSLIRAVFAGWLIALMVWLLPAAESARVSIIIILTYLIGIGGFGHIIAGSTTMFYLVVVKSISLATYFSQFFVPTLLGNVVGGMALVAALGHAQVVGGKEGS